MYKLNGRYEINRIFFKYEYIRYSPSETKNTINTATSQIYIKVPRKDSLISLLKTYLDLNFDVIHTATNNRYVDGNDIWLVNLGVNALFNNSELPSGSGKHLENIHHAHIVSLMYKLVTSARGPDDLSIGFDRDRGRRQRELTNNKNQKSKYHIRIYLKDIFDFAEHQDKATYGLRYKILIRRNTDSAILNKDNEVNVGEIKVIAIEWYVPRYTPSISEQTIFSNQILKKISTKLQNVETSVFMKELNTQNLWSFQLGTQ